MVAPNTYIGQQFTRFSEDWSHRGASAAGNVDDLKQRIDYAMILGKWALDRYARLPLKEESVVIGEGLQSLLTQWLETVKQILRETSSATRPLEIDAAFRELISDVQIALSMPVRESYEQMVRIKNFGHVDCVTTEELRRELRSRVGA